MATTIRVYIDGGGTPAASVLMAADRSFSAPVSGIPDGDHTIEVTAQEDGKGESSRVLVLTPEGSSVITVARGQIQHALAGDASGIASAAADLTAPGSPTQHALAGSVTGTGAAAGDLTAPIGLAGSATGIGAAAADLTTGAPVGNVFTDDFNRASLGTDYTALPGYSLPTISANRLGGGGAYVSSRTFASDQYVEVYVPVWPATPSELVEVSVRASTSANTRYLAALSFDDYEFIGSVSLMKYVAGSVTVLGTIALGSLDAYLRIEVQGTAIRAFTKAASGSAWGTAKITASDSDIASGSVGVRVGGSARIDDFVAGDL